MPGIERLIGFDWREVAAVDDRRRGFEVAELALTAGVPVVPVGLQGTQDIQPIGHRFPKRAKVTIRFGEPIDFAGRFDGVAKGKARRQATDEIMAAIQRLSGQELAGVYNEISANPMS